MPGVEAPVVHTGIVLTVSGVSRCLSVEAYASASLSPLVAGSGLALAFDAPIVAEACGLGSIAAIEDVEVKLVGRGVHYSTPGLDKLLTDIAVRLYSEGNDVLQLEQFPVSSIDARGLAGALAASLSGSRVFLGGYGFPIGELEGRWAVVIRLRKRISTEKLVEYVVGEGGNALTERMLDVLDTGVDGLAGYGLWAASLAGRHAANLIKRVLRAGAEAAVLDTSGRIVVAIVEDEIEASLLSAKLRDLGDRFEGIVVA